MPGASLLWVGGGGFWGRETSPKRAACPRVFRARGLYTIKKRLADFFRSANRLKRPGFCGILMDTAPLGYHAYAPRISRLRPSDITLTPLGYHAYFLRRAGGLRAAKWRCWLLLGTVRT